ncbi:MAG TPA: hypothetical protein VEH58_04295 [Dehalococcoidales bacterium]|nr:hypothetical protein [Dehalococcoidales bacterium]
MVENDNNIESRQERRAKKLFSRKERITKHGKNIAQIYKNAVTKRAKPSK